MGDFQPYTTLNGDIVICQVCNNPFPYGRSFIPACDYISCPNCNNTICMYCGRQVESGYDNRGTNTSAHNQPGIRPTVNSFNAHFGFRPVILGSGLPNGGWCLQRAQVRPTRDNGPIDALTPASMDAPVPIVPDPGPVQSCDPIIGLIDEITNEISEENHLEKEIVKILVTDVVNINPGLPKAQIKDIMKTMINNKYKRLGIHDTFKYKYLKYKAKYKKLKNL